KNKIRKMFSGVDTVILENKVPSYESLEKKFNNIKESGLYLHIPFCRQICPYCPYNKEIYKPEKAKLYVEAVKKEIDFYRNLLGGKPITSFYIGGGTPTTILYNGLYELLEYIYKNFNMQCDIHMESHLNDLSSDNLNTIKSFGIQCLSVGVEALEDKYLEFLKRPYNTKKAKEAIERAVNSGFKCFNIDFIFALPGQTYKEIEKAGYELAKMGVDQIAAYPLFIFPYTEMWNEIKENNASLLKIFNRKNMLGILENIFYVEKYERTSVWAFTKEGFPKYCSVTVPLYIGLGASGGTCLKDVFYLNTFNVGEYIDKLNNSRMVIALSLDMPEKMQMAWWFYWRIYETRFKRSDFEKRFGKYFDEIYGKYIKLFFLSGLIKKDDGNEIILSDRGTFWLHAFEDLFSIDYINKLWGTSKQNPWPEKVAL
ncbi:MAG: radical SAM protein, partial [Actinobacteria bacterium]|nr:radical SAM protein [Actinomycetota bacterium]